MCDVPADADEDAEADGCKADRFDSRPGISFIFSFPAFRRSIFVSEGDRKCSLQHLIQLLLSDQ